jgi:ketosteroid isomerase-like protein
MDVALERDRLLERDAAWARLAAENGDVDEIVDYWTDDAIVVPAGMPEVVGRDALRQYVAGTRDIPGFQISWSSSDAELSADGTMGFVLSSNQITMNGPDGEPVTSQGRAVTVWRRDKDGRWRCAVDIWNSAAE